MASTSPDSDPELGAASAASAGEATPVEQAAPPGGPAIYFDGRSNRRQNVTIGFANQLVLRSPDNFVSWPYDDIRRVDGPSGTLRVSCLSASPLARLEIREPALAAELVGRCSHIDQNSLTRGAVARIVGWSLAAVASIIAVVLVVLPFAADRLTPLVPPTMERHLGEAAVVQVQTLFGDKLCDEAAGQAAFAKLVTALRRPAGLDDTIASQVLDTPIPNAFALPGGRFFLFRGLLDKANDPDEVAGVLAHELGHLKHRDNLRLLIHNGGSSFLIGLLFGDITGAGAAIFATRAMISASYSREAEEGADSFAIEVMHKLGRPTRPMGELMFRITGREDGKRPSLWSSHPLTEDRLARMRAEDRPATGAPLLSAEEWKALKGICK
ncbi:metalloendopeptidase [Bradyrhizobium sp. SSBR45G]|uniref:M48 family metallopeptidase n=1 Tax=unclassified Bradyrhizobium TaxID=2631580 RepID=UPI0023429294|nr:MULTISPECIES: M48 family metallopeptidase [unclassified Bradyrhizobium]GLH81639.1 metalloendopeptidase [Bradyrhizobium sp. SSBR45G]GLH89932.1 metalloendopeptidase [Bradyrhizobium sp. SSBR45R]